MSQAVTLVVVGHISGRHALIHRTRYPKDKDRVFKEEIADGEMLSYEVFRDRRLKLAELR